MKDGFVERPLVKEVVSSMRLYINNKINQNKLCIHKVCLHVCLQICA